MLSLAFALHCTEEGRNPDEVTSIVGFQEAREVQGICKVCEVRQGPVVLGGQKKYTSVSTISQMCPLNNDVDI